MGQNNTIVSQLQASLMKSRKLFQRNRAAQCNLSIRAASDPRQFSIGACFIPPPFSSFSSSLVYTTNNSWRQQPRWRASKTNTGIKFEAALINGKVLYPNGKKNKNLLVRTCQQQLGSAVRVRACACHCRCISTYRANSLKQIIGLACSSCLCFSSAQTIRFFATYFACYSILSLPFDCVHVS